MQKNNVKSFICSFLFSILAVYAVQKVFLRAPQNETLPSVKPEKISLFSESKSPDVDSFVLASARTPSVDISKINDLTATNPVIDEKTPKKEEDTFLIKEEKLIVEPIPEDIPTDLASASEISFTPEEISEIKEQQELDNAPIVYADISDTFEENQESAPLVVAEKDLSEDIPLAEGTQSLHDKISVAQASEANKIAMVEPSTLINTMSEPDILKEEKTLAEADIKKEELSDMFVISQDAQQIDESAWDTAVAKTEDDQNQDRIDVSSLSEEEEDNPWVMAIGNKFAKNQAAVEAFSKEETAQTKEEPDESPLIDIKEETVEQTFVEPLLKEKTVDTKLAYQMIQNILIPIPEDILNDGDLTPDLASSPDGSNKEKKNTRRIAEKKADLNEDEKQTGLFKSISSWFNKNKDDDDNSVQKNKQGKGKNSDKPGVVDTIKEKVYSALGDISDYKKNDGASIMPAELRLSFQPNRAEISGQTLKWIYAFADNARDNNDVYIEVRIDGTSSYALQQKRLNLLSNIFSSRGVDYRKINTIFTSREPNSFIIRNIRFNNKEKGETDE